MQLKMKDKTIFKKEVDSRKFCETNFGDGASGYQDSI